MRRCAPYTALLAAMGVVPFALLLCTGCGESSSSQASARTADSPARETVDEPVRAASATEKVSVEKDPDQTSAPESADASANVVTRKPVENAEHNAAQSRSAVSRAAASPSRKGTREISFDTIKFDMEKGEPFERSMLTDAIEKLNGVRVRIRGYMLPSFQQSGIKQFVLVRDNQECCFGPGAALFDCVIVDMGEQSTNFSVRPVAVEGTFSIREFKGPDDTHLAIYHLDGERVR
jgi:hypothetical protein